MKNPLWFLAKQDGPLEVVLFSGGIVPSSSTRSFLILVPQSENAYRRRFVTLPRPNTNDTVSIWKKQSSGRYPNNLGILFLAL